MGTQAGGMGNRNKAMLISTSPCALPWLLLGPEPSSPTSSQLYFTDEITNWLREGYGMLEDFQSFPCTSQGIQWEVGDFQPDPSYLPNGGERRDWIIG